MSIIGVFKIIILILYNINYAYSNIRGWGFIS